jgi:hypothetical protein
MIAQYAMHLFETGNDRTLCGALVDEVVLMSLPMLATGPGCRRCTESLRVARLAESCLAQARECLKVSE